MKTLQFRNASPPDANRCFDLETSAYDGDEAASLEKIFRRIAEHPDGFLLLQIGDDVVGFNNSGCTHDVDLSDHAIKDLVGHDPDAPNVVILSVVVDPAHQGRGHSTRLMREFIERMRAAKKKTIHLMCKKHHVPLYEKFGYLYARPSASDHGGENWHEMWMDLTGH